MIWSAQDDATGLEGSGEVSWVLDRSVHGSVMNDVGRGIDGVVHEIV